MAKFYGVIGYAETKDDGHGVWTEEIIEKEQFCAAMSFEELHLAVDAFLGFIDRLSVLCL